MRNTRLITLCMVCAIGVATYLPAQDIIGSSPVAGMYNVATPDGPLTMTWTGTTKWYVQPGSVQINLAPGITVGEDIRGYWDIAAKCTNASVDHHNFVFDWNWTVIVAGVGAFSPSNSWAVLSGQNDVEYHDVSSLKAEAYCGYGTYSWQFHGYVKVWKYSDPVNIATIDLGTWGGSFEISPKDPPPPPPPTPELSTWALLACSGLFGVGMLRRRRTA